MPENNLLMMLAQLLGLPWGEPGRIGIPTPVGAPGAPTSMPTIVPPWGLPGRGDTAPVRSPGSFQGLPGNPRDWQRRRMDQRRRFRGKEATGTPKEGMLRQLAGRHLQQTGKGGARDWLMTPPEQRKLSTQPVKAAQGINVTDPEVFKGSDLLTSLLSMLGGQAGTFGVDLPAVQQQLFGLLGMVIPGMYGQTDPAVQRAMAGAPQFYRAQGSPTVYVQMPDGTFRAIGDPATFKAMGGQWGQVKGVKPGTFKGQSGQGITLGDVPGVLQQFERPTLEAQQLRTQRELRGLSAVPGAGQMPSYR